MASKAARCVLALVIASILFIVSTAAPARAASTTDTVPTQYHHFKFYLDPALLTDMGFAQAVLPKYVADMNTVLAKNTSLQLVFDPDTDIIPAPTKPETDSATPPLPTEGFDIWAYAVASNYSTSYGGFASVDASGAGVLAGLYWTRLYDPDQLTTAAAAQDYVIQVDNMLHELAHVFGGGIGEYYSLSHVTDTTQAAPLLNIEVTSPGDPYWSDKQDFLGDPLLELNRPASRSQYLAAARYSDLTAAILNGDYRNGVPSFNQFTVQVVDAGGQAVPGAEVKVWNVSGRYPNPSTLLYDVTTDGNGQAMLAWGGTGSAHTATNLLRLIKVYVGGVPYSPARYVSIFDADIAQLVHGQSSLVVTLQKINQPPTAVTLSNGSINENQPAGTLVAELGAVDADSGETFSYRFCGGADDGSFQIDGNRLLSAVKFDYERQTSYSICLEADDGRGGVVDQATTIQINNLPDTITASLPTLGVDDGWVLESARGSNVGSRWNANNARLLIGTDASGRRYRSVLAFSTSGVPSGAIITQVTLKVKRQSVVGNPFGSLGKLVVDAGKPLIGTAATLQSMDFQAGAGVGAAGVIGGKIDSSGWYSAVLSPAAYTLVSSNNLVELRLRFTGTGNAGAAYLGLYSGNAALASRPVLIVEYEMP